LFFHLGFEYGYFGGVVWAAVFALGALTSALLALALYTLMVGAKQAVVRAATMSSLVAMFVFSAPVST
jgi:hypothetical protein